MATRSDETDKRRLYRFRWQIIGGHMAFHVVHTNQFHTEAVGNGFGGCYSYKQGADEPWSGGDRYSGNAVQLHACLSDSCLSDCLSYYRINELEVMPGSDFRDHPAIELSLIHISEPTR